MLSACPADLLPIQPAPLDKDNLFAQSCRLAFVGSMHGVTRGNDYAVTYDSGVTHPLGQYGHQMRGTTTADGAKIAPEGLASVLPTTSAFTCAMLLRVNSLGSRRIFVGDFNTAGTSASFYIEQTAANKYKFAVINTAPIEITFTSGANVTTGWHFVEMTQNASVLYGYLDGALLGQQTMSATRRVGTSTDLRVGRGGAYTSLGFDGDVAYCYFFDKAFPLADLQVLRSNPTQIFKLPRQRSRVGVAGSNFNVAVTEALAAADAASAALIANAAISEAMAAADATLAAMIAAVSASESVTLTDTPSAAMTAIVAVAESITATDAPTAALSAAATVSEAASLTDALNGSVGLLTGSVTESLTLTDAPSVTFTAAVAVAEAVSLLDALIGSANRIYTGAVVEAASASDAWTAVLTGGVLVNPRARSAGRITETSARPVATPSRRSAAPSPRRRG